MSQSCNCDAVSVEIPVTGIKLSLLESAFPKQSETGGALNTWESDWFNIAASGAYDFTHSLALEKPWKCMPRIIGRVKTASGGWQVGEILFCDGCNYVGCTGDCDFGWTISVSSDTAHVSFGNYVNYMGILRAGGASSNILPKKDVECKLLITY